jgi:glycosyltransferase involved in cell wall biosynthesis
MSDAGGRVVVADPSLFTLPYDHELCQHLAEGGQEVTLVGRPLRPGEGPTSAPRYRFLPLFYPLGEGRRGRRLPAALRLAVKGVEHAVGVARLARRLRRSPPWVVHFQWLPLPALDRRLLAAVAGVAPLVLTVHDATVVRGASVDRLQHAWPALLDRFQGVVALTAAGRSALVERGLDPAAVSEIPHPPLPLVGPLPPPPGGPGRVVLLLGEIKPYKGVDTALRALAALPERFRLVVAGRPRMDLAPLVQLAAELGVGDRVEWRTGFVPVAELPALIGACHVVVLPYRDADASGVLALVAGLDRPLVASAVGALAEVVPGLGGALVPPDDPPALAAALAAAADGAPRRPRAGMLPTWTEAAEHHLEVYARARRVWEAAR